MAQRFLIQMAGHAGAGKTTVARELAQRTGAALLDLDTIKSALLGVGIGWEHASKGSYGAIYALVEDLLSVDGAVVIVDTPSYWPEIGVRLVAAADRHGASHLFLECVAEEAVRAERLQHRPHRRSQVGGLGANPIDAPLQMDVLHHRPIHCPAGTTRVVVHTDEPVDLVSALASTGLPGLAP